MNDADALVARLVLQKLHTRDYGWRDAADNVPEHFETCPEVTAVDVDTGLEMWFDTGVEATRITATLHCPHRLPFEWEWADLGELPDLLCDLATLEQETR